MNSESLRNQALRETKTVIVKVGTRVLTSAAGGVLDLHRIKVLSGQLCRVIDSGRRVILVSSGAVGAGVGKLKLASRPKALADLQAVAAIGQTELIQAYERAFAEHGRHGAQVLLTAEDLRHRSSYLNVRNALRQILALGAIPIINENDCVAIDELMTTFGDNDRLAALVSSLMNDAMLVILSDVDGLYDRHPSLEGAKVIPTVTEIDSSVTTMAQDAANSVSKGGMGSKLVAAKMATAYGHYVVIAPGRDDRVLDKLLACEPIGTLFTPGDKPIYGRLRWIDSSAAITGRLHVDAGAAKAMGSSGKSLLAVGIVRIDGSFERGDVVAVIDPQGREVGRGLCNYSSDDVARIMGLPSSQIDEVLGHCPYESVVHRDNFTSAITARIESPR